MHDPAPESIAAAAAPFLAKLAAAVVFGTGVLVGLTGVQTLMAVNIIGPLAAAPWVLLVVGAAMAYFGAMVYRARYWGAVAATVATTVGFVVAATWAVISFTHGLFSLFALMAIPMSIAAIALSAVSIVPCKKASDARARLAAQGLDLGL